MNVTHPLQLTPTVITVLSSISTGSSQGGVWSLQTEIRQVGDYGNQYMQHHFFTCFSTFSMKDTVFPQCGKMVVFTSGPESIHGVKPIITGERCTLAMWYSLDKTFEVNYPEPLLNI